MAEITRAQLEAEMQRALAHFSGSQITQGAADHMRVVAAGILARHAESGAIRPGHVVHVVPGADRRSMTLVVLTPEEVAAQVVPVSDPMGEIRALSDMTDPDARDYALDYVAKNTTLEDIFSLIARREVDDADAVASAVLKVLDTQLDWETEGSSLLAELFELRSMFVRPAFTLRRPHQRMTTGVWAPGQPELRCPMCTESDYAVSVHSRQTGHCIIQDMALADYTGTDYAKAVAAGAVFVLSCYGCAHSTALRKGQEDYVSH